MWGPSPDPSIPCKPMKLAPLAAVLLFITSLSLGAQREGDPEEFWDPLEKGLTADGDLFPVKWKIDDRGRMLIKPCPSTGMVEFGPMFRDGLLGDRLRYLRHLGAVGMFRVLFMGNRDFLSLADAEYVFRKRKLPRRDAEIRQRIALDASGDSALLQETAHLDRLLAVRIASARKLKSARGELLELAADTEADQLLRLAAEDALFAIMGRGHKPATTHKSPPRVEQTLAAVPQSYHLICTIQQRQVPAFSRLGHVARSLIMESILSDIRAAGGGVTPSMLAGAQFLADMGTILPYEFCLRLGNFRIIRATVTLLLHGEHQQPLFWARIDGWFDPRKVRRALEDQDFKTEHDEKQGTVAATFANLGLQVLVARDHAELRSISYPVAKRGVENDPLAAACVGGPHALGLWVKGGKPLHTLLSRSKVDLPAFENAVLTFDLHPDGKLEARTTLPDEKQAAAMAKWLEDKIEFLNSKSRAPGRRAFNVFKKGLQIGSKGDVMHVTWSPKDITLDAVLEAFRGR